jgi:hypothetical protein
MKTEYTIDDLSYEELNYSRNAMLDSSHWLTNHYISGMILK